MTSKLLHSNTCIYILEVLERDLSSIDKCVYTKSSQSVMAEVNENALKPVYDVFHDFRNNLHCVAEFNPFVMSLDVSTTRLRSSHDDQIVSNDGNDDTIQTTATTLSSSSSDLSCTTRLEIGPRVCEKYL